MATTSVTRAVTATPRSNCTDVPDLRGPVPLPQARKDLNVSEREHFVVYCPNCGAPFDDIASMMSHQQAAHYSGK